MDVFENGLFSFCGRLLEAVDVVSQKRSIHSNGASEFLRRLSGEYVDEEIDEAFFDLFAFEKEERDYISREYR